MSTATPVGYQQSLALLNLMDYGSPVWVEPADDLSNPDREAIVPLWVTYWSTETTKATAYITEAGDTLLGPPSPIITKLEP